MNVCKICTQARESTESSWVVFEKSNRDANSLGALAFLFTGFGFQVQGGDQQARFEGLLCSRCQEDLCPTEATAIKRIYKLLLGFFLVILGIAWFGDVVNAGLCLFFGIILVPVMAGLATMSRYWGPPIDQGFRVARTSWAGAVATSIAMWGLCGYILMSVFFCAGCYLWNRHRSQNPAPVPVPTQTTVPKKAIPNKAIPKKAVPPKHVSLIIKRDQARC